MIIEIKNVYLGESANSRKYVLIPPLELALMGRERLIPQDGIGMDEDVSADKRDCDVDTDAMAEFAKALFDRSWMGRMEDDLAAMNECEVGHSFVFPDSVIIWGLTLRAALDMSYRMARGIVNVFLEEAISVAVDSTGMSLNKYGGWLAHR